MERWTWLLVGMESSYSFAQEPQIALPQGLVARFGTRSVTLRATNPAGDWRREATGRANHLLPTTCVGYVLQGALCINSRWKARFIDGCTDDAGLQATDAMDYSVGPPGEVPAIAGDRIIISLGSANRVSFGDRLEVIWIYQLSDGPVVLEPQAESAAAEVIDKNRSACGVVRFFHAIEARYQVRLVTQ